MLLTAAVLLAPLPVQSVPAGPGRVAWGRDRDAALAAARRTRRPVLELELDVSGCGPCAEFGRGPLSVPLVVEALEELFVPLALPRAGGERPAGAGACDRPRVRFHGPGGAELLPGADRVRSAEGLVSLAVAALRAGDREVPLWLGLLDHELQERSLESATFAMACFWQGEALLGSLDGVLATEAGWLDGREVVAVRFDPGRLDYATLVEAAGEMRCASVVYARSDEQLAVARKVVGGERARRSEEAPRAPRDSDRKHYLERSALRHVPLTPLQALKVNAALGLKRDALVLLSPRQRVLYGRVRSALERDPAALGELLRPGAVGALVELAAYEAALVARLDALEQG